MSAKPFNVDGYREVARRRLPRAVFDFVDGGAEDELTMRANREAFATLRLRNRVYTDEGAIELGTTLCGQPMSMPIMLSPAGNTGMIHPEGERAAARVAARRGLIMFMSGGGSYTIEEIAEAADPKPWYQLYAWVGREFYGGLIDRVRTAGFRGIVVTVDSPPPGGGLRERDRRNAFTLSPKLTPRNAYELARHPRWTTGVLRHRRVIVKAFSEGPAPRRFFREATRAAIELNRKMTRPLWNDLAWMRDRWQGPFGIKGIVDPDDARRAVEIGADVVYVSNHGGRQLDSTPAAIEALPEVVEAVAGRAEVILDGGVRRGTDVIKALCLGARAVGIGRPWVYGLAANGIDGVDGVVQCIRRELSVSMALLGQPDVQKLDRSYLAPAGIRFEA